MPPATQAITAANRTVAAPLHRGEKGSSGAAADADEFLAALDAAGAGNPIPTPSPGSASTANGGASRNGPDRRATAPADAAVAGASESAADTAGSAGEAAPASIAAAAARTTSIASVSAGGDGGRQSPRITPAQIATAASLWALPVLASAAVTAAPMTTDGNPAGNSRSPDTAAAPAATGQSPVNGRGGSVSGDGLAASTPQPGAAGSGLTVPASLVTASADARGAFADAGAAPSAASLTLAPNDVDAAAAAAAIPGGATPSGDSALSVSPPSLAGQPPATLSAVAGVAAPSVLSAAAFDSSDRPPTRGGADDGGGGAAFGGPAAAPSVAAAAAASVSIASPDASGSAAAAATATAPDGGSSGILDQVAARLTGMLAAGRLEVVLRLYPPDLGELSVRMQVDGRDVTAWFETPLPQVQQALSQGMEQLQAGLANAGFSLNDAWVGGDAWKPRSGAGNSSPPPRSGAAADGQVPSLSAGAELSPVRTLGVSLYV